MTSCASATGSKLKLDSNLGHTLSVKLFVGGIRNIHEASSLGGFHRSRCVLKSSLDRKAGERYALQESRVRGGRATNVQLALCKRCWQDTGPITLHRTKHLGWGTDTHLYRDIGAFREEFPQRLRAAGPRVLKQNRGNGGEGVWKVEFTSESGQDNAIVRVLHAPRGSVPQEMPLGKFMSRC
jgi:hypothetical protein